MSTTTTTMLPSKRSFPELEPKSIASDADKKTARRVVRLVSTEAAKRKPVEQQVIQTYSRAKITNLTTAVREAMAKAEKECEDYDDSIPKVIASKSAPQKRVVRILPRGNWMVDSGEVVHAKLPKTSALSN
jgi:hypothetical protein